MRQLPRLRLLLHPMSDQQNFTNAACVLWRKALHVGIGHRLRQNSAYVLLRARKWDISMRSAEEYACSRQPKAQVSSWKARPIDRPQSSIYPAGGSTNFNLSQSRRPGSSATTPPAPKISRLARHHGKFLITHNLLRQPRAATAGSFDWPYTTAHVKERVGHPPRITQS